MDTRQKINSDNLTNANENISSAQKNEDEIVKWLTHFETTILGINKRYHSFNTYQSNDSRIYSLAMTSIEKNPDDVYYFDDEKIQFSKLGVLGITNYLAKLSSHFTYQLQQNKISKGYTLYLPQTTHYHSQTDNYPTLPFEQVKGMNKFLNDQLERSTDFTFCCQSVHLSINPYQDNNADECVIELCQLLNLLDKTKLKQLVITLPTLDPGHLERLTHTLQSVSHTSIQFSGSISLEQALILETINTNQLQEKVEYTHQHNYDDNALIQHDISNQPSIVTAAKIKAMMETEIHLRPVQGKIGHQNQHHFEHEAKQQTEVNIVKSWQIEQAKEVKQESRYGSDILHGDESNQLIAWHHIEGALNEQHPDHKVFRAKLGEEIINYQYKGRNLIDLWQRLTGDIRTMKQDIIPDKKNDKYSMGYFSRFRPKQISHKTLLTIVRHPHLFQDGLHLESLPDDFGFSSNHGALFTRPHDYYYSIRKPNPFSVQINSVPHARELGAEHFQRLIKSDIPSRQFYDQLSQLASPLSAWQNWRNGFAALNRFNQQGIHAINQLVITCFNNVAEKEHEPLLDYFILTINYYHHHKIAKQIEVLTAQQIQFEYQQNQDYLNGVMGSLSNHSMNSLPNTMRERIHQELTAIMNHADLTMSDALQENSHKQLLQESITYHQNKLSGEMIKTRVYELLDARDVTKLMELTVSNDTSIVYNIFSMLEVIDQTWGQSALNDFIHCFITPAINLAPLARPQHQQALVQLLRLSETEYHWWQSLTLQHVEQSGFAEFPDLMNAFQHFLDELAELGLNNTLTMPCPLQGINNLQVGLNRVVSLLKRTKKPAEQMRNLARLDWSACGVVYATQEINYQFVNADMQLNLAYESEFQKFILIKNGHYHHFDHYQINPFNITWYKLENWEDESTNQQLFKFTLGCFFRYLGAEKFTAPMPVYQQLLDALALPEKYQLINKVTGVFHRDDKLVNTLVYRNNVNAVILSALLPVIAFATTGQRGLDRLPHQQEERIRQLREFVSTLYECARARYRNDEMQKLLDENNAVDFEELIKILKQCSELYPDSRYHGEANDTHMRLDLDELTLILREINQSQHHYDQINTPDSELVKSLWEYLPFVKDDQSSDKKDQWCGNQILDRQDNQLLFACQYTKKYKQYYVDALHRIRQHNQSSDFACFLMTCATIENHTFSYENKGRLLRIMSLVHLKLENLTHDAPLILEFFQQLYLYQEKVGSVELDVLLSSLSCLVPNHHNHLEITDLNHFIKKCISHAGNLDFRSLIQSDFSSYHIDHNLDEVKDVDFYPTPNALDEKFHDLGQFYSQIKSVVLQQYPVLFGDNKFQIWQDFLNILAQLDSADKHHQILQTLLQSAHDNIDLNTLNAWLAVLLKRDKNRVQFHPDYFKTLSPVLLNHPKKQAFIDILNSWFTYNDRHAAAYHTDFIKLLNKISSVKNGESCLKDFYDCARTIALISDSESFPWHDNFIKLINTWQRRNLSIETLNQVFQCFTKFNDTARNNTQYKPILLAWLSNIENTFELTLMFSQEWDNNQSQQSFNKMTILAQVTGLDLNIVHQSLAQLTVEQLAQLAACYQTKPLPASSLLQSLLSKEISLHTFLTQHTCDPHHERDENKLKQQFDDEILWSYLNKVKYLYPDHTNALAFSEKLYAQLKLMNYMGYHQFRLLSVTELSQRLHSCRKILIHSTDPDEKLVTLLTAFSLVREAVYKTSPSSAPLWPSAVQILAVLSALNHELNPKEGLYATPLFLQMATGEGKSLLAVFLGILTWAKGGPVTVVTHRASLALRDVHAYKSLFDGLRIESRHLTADRYLYDYYVHQINMIYHQFFKFMNTEEQKPEFNGIYYAEFNDIALIRQQRLLNFGLDIDNMSFIIDEADELILHNQTDNNLTHTKSADDVHPHAWAFEALAAYLENISKDSIHSVCLADLVDYLSRSYPLGSRVCQQIDFLIQLPVYLQAVWQARTLVDQVDYIAKRKDQKSDDYYAAVLLNDKFMPPNVTFNGLIQQALHGWQNYYSKKNQVSHYFPIAPETTLYSTMSPEAVLNWMKETGTVIALSATIGSHSELMEMQLNYGFDYIKLPKKQSSLRVDYPVRFCKDQHLQFHAITEICAHYTGDRTQLKSRSILIPVESIEIAKKLNETLQKFNPHVLHADLDDIDDNMLSQLERQSGQSGHVLIAVVGLIVRGFDIKLTSAREVIVITTYLKNGVDEIQVKGRASRVNQATGLRDKGRFYAVYDLEKERSRYPGLNINSDDIDINPEAFKQRQYFAYYQQESALRLHRQLTGISKNAIQNHFLSLWTPLFNNEKVLKPMRDGVMDLYTEVLKKIFDVLPHDDFSQMTEHGSTSRHEYNRNLLEVYEDTLKEMQSLFRLSLIQDPQDIISFLMKQMEHEQLLLIENHKKSLSTGGDEPSIKIYKHWTRGVKYNAYLDAGKQSTGSYLFESFNAWFRLSNEDKEKIQHNKIALEKKESLKNDKKSDFIKQLTQIKTNTHKNNDLFMYYLSVYHQTLSEDMTDNFILSPSPNQAMDNDELTNSIIKKYNYHKSISFIHDPLIGKACQVSLVSPSLRLFEELQAAIHQAYEAYNITEKLNFRIIQLNENEFLYYCVIVDFSDHTFDHLDKQQLLSHIAKSFNVDLEPLLQSRYIPSLTAMQASLKEVYELIQTSNNNIPNDVAVLIKKQQHPLSRQQYYKRIFKPAINLLEQHYDQFDDVIKLCINALLHCHQDIFYHDHSGHACTSYPHGFKNLSGLLENEKKRSALTIIDQLMNRFSNQALSDSLLFRQQAECLTTLGLSIIHASADESLHSIYDKWLQTSIQYQFKSFSIYDLMQLRQEKSSFFGINKSPDVFVVCQKIENLSTLTEVNRSNLKEGLRT